MKYTFNIYKFFDDRDGLEKEIPSIFIENHEEYGCYFLTEISNLRLNHIREIVPSLEKILIGELEQYDFGYEVYSIECKKEISQVIDTFDDWRCIAEIGTSELYEMMRDWRDFRLENESIDNNTL